MLTIFQTQDQAVSLMQTSWASEINPILKSPLVNGSFLKNIVLAIGANTINHLLGRMQQGWIITDQNAAAQVYRSSPFNDKNLVLTSDAVVTVGIYVY